MPGSSVKDLHLASSMGQLNKMAEDIPKISNARVTAKSADKVFRAAVDHDLLGDEERAYVFYMRFFNLYTAIKKTVEYMKDKQFYDNLVGKNNCIKAIDTAEKLSASLKNRYAELEAKAVASKLDKLDAEVEKKGDADTVIAEDEEKKDPEKDDKKPQAAIDSYIAKPSGPGVITATELYNLLLNKDLAILLMDIRCTKDYDESHIRHHRSINVPADSVAPGSTTQHIEPKLPPESIAGWKERGSVDYIILLDWHCSAKDLKTPDSRLRCLKDAIFKWDQTVLVKSEPTILEGGYNDWLNHYPTLTTNSAVDVPLNNAGRLSLLPSLDTIEYDLDLEFLKSPEQKERERQEKQRQEKEKLEKELTKDSMKNGLPDLVLIPKTVSEDDISIQRNIPSVDRTTKPKPAAVSNQPPAILNNGMSRDLLEKVDNREQALKNQARTAHKDFSVNDLRRQLEEDTDAKPDNRHLEQKTEQPRLEQVKSAPVTPVVPAVNRALKPKLGSNEVASEGADSTSLEPPPSSSQDIATGRDNDLVVRDVQDNLQKENKKLVLEHQARLAKLKSEDERMRSIQNLTAEEEKKAADVMRLRRQVEGEIHELQQKKEKEEAEYKHRKEEREKLEMESIARLREEKERKLAEEKALKTQQLKQAEKEAADKVERERKEADRKRLKAAADKAKLEEERKRQTEIARLEAEREEKEKAAQARAEMERADQAKAEKEMQQKLERERVAARLEEEERKKSEATREQIKKETVPSKAIHSAGWEKKRDYQTGRFYYIDHNTKTTHWQAPLPPVTTKQEGHTRKVKLKDDSTAPSSGGLKRSHSSPNIAKMMQDEDQDKHTIHSSLMRPSQPKPRQVLLQTEVSAAKVRNLQPTWGTVKRGLTGLRNLGNTCYMNSTLQCLSNTTPLATYFLTDAYREDINRENFLGHQGEVAEEFAVVIKALWAGQYRNLAPRDFKGMVSKNYELFMGFDQQDAQELLLFLMDGLHEDLNRVEHRRLPEQENDGVPDEIAAEKAWKMHRYVNDSVIVEFFQGQFKSTVSCLTCDKKSVTFDAFMYLTLPIPSNNRCSLRECLVQFSKEEKMTGDARWDCPSCKKKQNAVKRIVIWKLPPILLIHLNRFFNQGRWRDKITSNVDFPLNDLDLDRYISGPKRRSAYTLYGVSNHYGGTMNGGHYTAFCYNPNAKGWFKYDDHEVFEMSKGEVQSPAAYILYYSSMKLDTPFK